MTDFTDTHVNPLQRPLKAYHDAKGALSLLNSSFNMKILSDDQVRRIWETANEKTDALSGALRSYFQAIQAAGDPANVVLECTWGVKIISEISALLATSVILQRARLGNGRTWFKKQETLDAVFEDTEKQGLGKPDHFGESSRFGGTCLTAGGLIKTLAA